MDSENTNQPPGATPKPSSNPPAPPHKGKGLDHILLPKKDVHSSASAQRVSAGELLAQEQNAALPKTPRAAPPPPPPKSAKSKKEESIVQPLETFRGDIEKFIKTGSVSAVSIATAQAKRNQKNANDAAETPHVPLAQALRRSLITVAGGVLILCAISLVSYVLLRPTSTTVATPANAPFISVDGTTEVSIGPTEPRGQVMAALQAAKSQTKLSVGLVGRLRPVSDATSTGAALPVDAQPFLALLAPDIPNVLLRTISPTYLLGVHSFDANQAFLLLKVDSYEQAFSGMLAWEPSMQQDLLPLFAYTPSPHIKSDTATTDTSSTTSAIPAIAQNPSSDFVQSNFSDAIIENHDARVLKNAAGDVYFLWTFLDRGTLLITTSPYTVREIITRLKNAPIVSIPGQ